MHLHAHSEPPSWSCFANKKKGKEFIYENYFDASDFVSLLCSQGVIIFNKLHLLKQTVS
jgi:hypothetical protein